MAGGVSVNLYRDNAKPPTERAAITGDLPLPRSDEPASRPWAFRTREDFPELLNRWGLIGVGVEVGVYRGGYSHFLLRNWPGALHCVDPWAYQSERRDLLNTPDIGDHYAYTLNHLSGYVEEGRCVIHRGYSTEVAREFAPASLDFVYIDALHDFASCLADMNAWAPLIKSGGVLAGHDYLDHQTRTDTVTEFGVVSAVRDWCNANGYDVARHVLTTTDDGYPTWVIRLR